MFAVALELTFPPPGAPPAVPPPLPPLEVVGPVVCPPPPPPAKNPQSPADVPNTPLKSFPVPPSPEA